MSEIPIAETIAAWALETKSGDGMTPPFYAETASVKGDENWPFWIVRNATCNSLGTFLPRKLAIAVADEMNRRSDHRSTPTTPTTWCAHERSSACALALEMLSEIKELRLWLQHIRRQIPIISAPIGLGFDFTDKKLAELIAKAEGNP